MNASFSPVVWSLACLVVQAAAVPVAEPWVSGLLPERWVQRFEGEDDPPKEEPKEEPKDDPAEKPAGEMTQDEFNMALTRALQMLAANGDQEAFDLIKKARENGGRLDITMEDARKIIERANQMASGGGKTEETPQGESPKEEEKPARPSDDEIKEAVRKLVKEGDKDALAVADHARRNKGELKVSDEQAIALVKRSKGEKAEFPSEGDDGPTEAEKALIEKGREAVRLLAKKGDKEARELLEQARRNRGEIELTAEKAQEFIDSAVEKDLMADADKEEAERMAPAQVKQLIKALADRGDRDAKAIMRKAKKNDDEITYTPEEEKEIIKNAKKAGLID